jgi:hypothetical protein
MDVEKVKLANIVLHIRIHAGQHNFKTTVLTVILPSVDVLVASVCICRLKSTFTPDF